MFPWLRAPTLMPPPVGPAVRSAGTGISPSSGAPQTPQVVTVTADANAHALNGLALKAGAVPYLLQGGVPYPMTGGTVDLVNQQLPGWTTPKLPAGGMAWVGIQNPGSQIGGLGVFGVYSLSAIASPITFDYAENPPANSPGATSNIFGTNFDGAMTVQLVVGGNLVTCPYALSSATQALVTWPSLPAGAYTLVLSSGSGNGSVARSRLGFRSGPFDLSQIEQRVGLWLPSSFAPAKWQDTSGADNHWLDVTGGANPASLVASDARFASANYPSGAPSVAAAGNSVMQLQNWNNGGVTSCLAIYVVVVMTTASGNHAIVTNEPTSSDLYEVNQANTTQWEWSGNAHIFLSTFAANTPGSLYAHCDQVSNTDVIQFQNGTATTNASSKTQATLTTLNIFSRLNTGVLSNQMSGAIAFALMTTKAIPAGQRTILSNSYVFPNFGCH